MKAPITRYLIREQTDLFITLKYNCMIRRKQIIVYKIFWLRRFRK